MTQARVLRRLYGLVGRLPPPLKRALVRLRENTYLVGVIGVVLDGEGRVLLFRHTYRPFAPWGLPSGWLSGQESLEQSIVREIREETGLIVAFKEVMLIETGTKPRRVDVWMRYRALPGPTRMSPEVEEAKFFSLDALPPLMASQERFLKQLRAQGVPANTED